MIKRHLLAIILVATFATTAPARPTIQQIESWIIANPSPQYPTEALARGEQGSGVIKLHFRVKTGTVRTASVTQSTGFKDLDAAAVKAFSQWRFKPDVLPTIRSLNSSTIEPFADEDFVAKIPITFALSSGGAVNVGGFGASRKPIILRQPSRVHYSERGLINFSLGSIRETCMSTNTSNQSMKPTSLWVVSVRQADSIFGMVSAPIPCDAPPFKNPRR